MPAVKLRTYSRWAPEKIWLISEPKAKDSGRKESGMWFLPYNKEPTRANQGDSVHVLHSSFENCLILTGPTGAGKTALGLEVAEHLGAEIISMDSMALYRGMDVGTAKPSPEERHRVPHHLIDVLEPWESASVAWWLDRAARACQEIKARGHRVLIVGGTPLYLKALLCGLFDGPPADSALRERLSREAERDGPEKLHERLARFDPLTAARLHTNDLRRIVRALEVAELTGRPISSWQTEWAATTADLQAKARVGWLDVPRAMLYERIDARVLKMFETGLVEEARRLHLLDRPLSREAGQALGYKEMFAYLDGQVGLEETIQAVQRRTRNLAKRQITWFRHLPSCRPVAPPPELLSPGDGGERKADRGRELTFALWGLTIESAGVA
jgi:tRNA dimethylallyltransferase